MIRNPLTRLLSAFRDKQLRKFEFLRPGIDYPQHESDSQVFIRFIENVLHSQNGTSNIHLQSQWDQMEVCRWPYDLLIPYEKIAQYLEVYHNITGTSPDLYPGSRESVGADNHSSTFYKELDQRQMDIIYNYYALDFKLLGYSKFGEENFPYLAA
jgi:hypothetical protein